MGGFECSTHRPLHGRRLDVIAATAHDRWAREDYERLRRIGMRTARDGIRWHLIETAPGRYNFDSVRGMLDAAREAGVQVIWDLVHYGWPDDLDVFSGDFIGRVAGLARAFADIASDRSDHAPWVVPVNEMSFLAWAAGDLGIFHPYARHRGDELKLQLVRGAIAAIRAMRDVNPAIRIVHTEPMINVVADPRRPHEAAAAEGHRQAQYAALDMIVGRDRPELGGRPEFLDVLGVNYYIHNQWVFPGGHGKTIEPSDARYRPVHEMLAEVQARYGVPIFIAETGIEDDARPAWLRYVGHEVRLARRRGVPVEGLCLYPVVNHPGWDDDRHCYNGLWDYADERGGREIYEPLAAEIARQQTLFAATPGTEPAEGDEFDADMLDVASHWMEIRSGREDIMDGVE